MSRIKIMTWNVENLFKPDAAAELPEQQRFDQKCALLARVINDNDPDIVALQEIGGEEPLHSLQQSLAGNFAHAVISLFPDRRGIRVAFLTKQAITERSDMVDFPPGPALGIFDLNAAGEAIPVTRMSRGALRICLTVDGLKLDVITTHLKSKLLTFPRSGGTSFSPRDETERTQVAGIALHKRTAEAVTLRQHANLLLESAERIPLILLGDMNDVPHAQTSLILCGPPGSEIGTRGFDMSDQGDATRLFNVAPLLPADRNYSRRYHGRNELLDQIFASEEFFPVGSDNKRKTPNVDSLVDFQTQLASIGDDPTLRSGEIAPDHAPVVADFSL
jgi:endonuclease/exonuclease/phosphatase family metal-dependent hydrolase